MEQKKKKKRQDRKKRVLFFKANQIQNLSNKHSTIKKIINTKNSKRIEKIKSYNHKSPYNNIKEFNINNNNIFLYSQTSTIQKPIIISDLNPKKINKHQSIIYKNIYDLLNDKYFCIIQVRGDGNCYYRSVIYSLLYSILFQSNDNEKILYYLLELNNIFNQYNDRTEFKNNEDLNIFFNTLIDIYTNANNSIDYINFMKLYFKYDLSIVKKTRILLAYYILDNLDTEIEGLIISERIMHEYLNKNIKFKDTNTFIHDYILKMGVDAQGFFLIPQILQHKCLKTKFSVTFFFDQKGNNTVYINYDNTQIFPPINIFIIPGHYDILILKDNEIKKNDNYNSLKNYLEKKFEKEILPTEELKFSSMSKINQLHMISKIKNVKNSQKYSNLYRSIHDKSHLYKTYEESINLGLASECVKQKFIDHIRELTGKNNKTAKYFVSDGLENYLDMIDLDNKSNFFFKLIFDDFNKTHKLCFVNSNGNGLCFFNSLYIFFTTIKNNDVSIGTIFDSLIKSLSEPEIFRKKLVYEYIKTNEAMEVGNKEIINSMLSSVPNTDFFTRYISNKYHVVIYIIVRNNDNSSIDISHIIPEDGQIEDYVFLINPNRGHYHTVISFTKEMRIELAEHIIKVKYFFSDRYKRAAFSEASNKYNGNNKININSILEEANRKNKEDNNEVLKVIKKIKNRNKSVSIDNYVKSLKLRKNVRNKLKLIPLQASEVYEKILQIKLKDKKSVINYLKKMNLHDNIKNEVLRKFNINSKTNTNTNTKLKEIEIQAQEGTISVLESLKEHHTLLKQKQNEIKRELKNNEKRMEILQSTIEKNYNTALQVAYENINQNYTNKNTIINLQQKELNKYNNEKYAKELQQINNNEKYAKELQQIYNNEKYAKESQQINNNEKYAKELQQIYNNEKYAKELQNKW